MRVGTKDLKNRLSHHLRLVRDGEHVLVTDRGRVIAELRPAHDTPEAEEAALASLEARGLLTRGRRKPTDFEPVSRRGRKLVSTLVTEDRR